MKKKKNRSYPCKEKKKKKIMKDREMLVAKDSTMMKLFGNTIPAPEIPAGAPAFSSGDVFGDSVGQNRGSSSVNGDGEEHEIQQV